MRRRRVAESVGEFDRPRRSVISLFSSDLLEGRVASHLLDDISGGKREVASGVGEGKCARPLLTFKGFVSEEPSFYLLSEQNDSRLLGSKCQKRKASLPERLACPSLELEPTPAWKCCSGWCPALENLVD